MLKSSVAPQKSTLSISLLGDIKENNQRHFSQKRRKLFGSEKQFVKLRSAHPEKLNLEHTFKTRKYETIEVTFSFLYFQCRIKDHILRTGSYVLSAICGYLLMLVVGTYNVWLFASIVLGAAFGYYLSDPLFTSYSSIEYRDSEIERRRNNDNYKLITSTCNRC